MAGKHRRNIYETAFDSKSCRSSDSSDLDIVTNYVLEGRTLHIPRHAVFYNECSPKRLKNTARNRLEMCNEHHSSGGSISKHALQLDANNSALLHGYSSATSTPSIYHPMAESAICCSTNDISHTFSESFIPPSHNVFARVVSDKRINNINRINNEERRSKNTNNLKEGSENRKYGSVDDRPSDRSASRHSGTNKIMEFKGRPKKRLDNFSSTESSSAGSLESIKSTISASAGSSASSSSSSTESNRSSSLSTHSSDSAVGNSVFHFAYNYRTNNGVSNGNKMHVLSPISDDRSFQETGCENCDNSGRRRDSPSTSPYFLLQPEMSKCNKKRASLQNKTNSSSVSLGADAEAQQCSDSGISVESRSETIKQTQNFHSDVVPFDMPKLRRRRLQQIQLTENSIRNTSSSVTSIDINDLPFDMPKLRRKMKTLSMEDSGVELRFDSQHSRHSGNDEAKCESNFDPVNNRRSLGLSLNLNEIVSVGSRIDTDLPLERQGWYHGAISRLEAENELRSRLEGSYLVRNSELVKNDYSLSLKGAKGFMHIRIQKQPDSSKFILGQLSSPFDSIPQIINHYSSNQLPIRGAEHMCLLKPVIAQLL